MKTLISLFTLLTLFFTASYGFGHDADQLGKITGTNIDLFYSDHAVSGQIDNKLIFAIPLTDEYGIKVLHRANGKDFEATFKKQENKSLAGTVTSENLKGEAKTTTFVVSKTDPKAGFLEGTLNGNPFKVTVSAKEMDGAHYVNPQFDVVMADRAFQFQLEGGKACMGCVVKIAFIVLGVLL